VQKPGKLQKPVITGVLRKDATCPHGNVHLTGPKGVWRCTLCGELVSQHYPKPGRGVDL
jgi:hypothetical protein